MEVRLVGGPGHEETVTVPYPPPPEIIWTHVPDPLIWSLPLAPLDYQRETMAVSYQHYRYHLVRGRRGRIWYEYPADRPR
jgi:hypothetical protein